MADLDDLSGRMLGEFVLRERLDEGGFGAVYRCEQPLLGREAVVKVLHRGLRRQSGALKRFLREAQLASRLDHPYAAHVYAFGVEEDDEILWIAMERVQGGTLNQWLETHKQMSLDEFVPFFQRVAEVVQVAHERGIVHRDLKPSNVMVIERAGQLLPKLLDFGIAKLLDEVANAEPLAARWSTGPAARIDPTLAETLQDTERTPAMRSMPPRRPGQVRLTRADAAIGSPPYMSPEQWDNPTAVGTASDLYSLGIIAYEALTGRRPFNANTIEDYGAAHRNAPVPPLGGDFSPALERFFQRALAKRPEDRWGSALELAAALRAELKTRMQSQIRDAAQQWLDRGRPSDLLWRGTVLAELETWRVKSKPQLDELETEFVSASRREELAAATAREQRISRIRRWLVAGVAATALAAIQYRGYLKAEMTQQVAEAAITQAEIEQGRQALLHGESAEAQTHLWQAYQRGARTPDVEFMLARALQPRMAEKARFQATYGRMWSAVFSPDGSRIVTTDDKAAQVWDASTHRLLLSLTHRDIVYDAVYASDGARIVTASRDGSVRVWNAATGALVSDLRYQARDGRQWHYYRVALSSDGRFVAAIDYNGDITHVWDMHSGAGVAELHNQGREVWTLAFSPDGRWLASGFGDVSVYDAENWKEVFSIAGTRVRALSFDPNSTQLLTGTFTGDESIWDIPSGRRIQHLREIGDPVDAVAFSPNGELVATSTRDGAGQVWNAKSGKLEDQFNYHHGKINGIEFDRGSQLLVSAGADGTVIVVDAKLGMPVIVLDGARSAVWAAHFDPSSRSIVTASWDGTARLWDATSPYQRWRASPMSDGCGVVASLEPDRRFVAVSCRKLPTRIWDTARDELIAELPSMTPVDDDYGTTFPAVTVAGDYAAIAQGNIVTIYALPGGRVVRTIRHDAAVNVVAFGPKGHDLVSGSVDGIVLFTRLGHDSVRMPRSPGSPGSIDAATILVDGRIVTSDAQRRLRIYDPNRAELLASLDTPSRAMLLRSSENGSRLVTIPYYSSADSPTLWDLDRYRLVGRLDGHIGLVRSARFALGGVDVITAGSDGAVCLWSAETGRLLQTYRGGKRFLADASLDPTGTMVVAASGDGLLRFWDVVSGRPLWTLRAHNSHVVALHFEGNDIVTRGFGGDLARWSLPDPISIIKGCPAEVALSEREACTMMPR